MKLTFIIAAMLVAGQFSAQSLQNLFDWSTKNKKTLAEQKFKPTTTSGSKIYYAKDGVTLGFPKQTTVFSYTFNIEDKKAVKQILKDINNAYNESPNWKNMTASKDLPEGTYAGTAKIDGVKFNLKIQYHDDTQFTLNFENMTERVVYVRTTDQTFELDK